MLDSPGSIQLEPPENKQAVLSYRRMARDVIETIVLALILFLAINTISARIRVESISMEPTLYRGDFVLVDRISYRLRAPDRGDVVVFYYPVDPTQKYVKRIIGLPGEEINIIGGKVIVDGREIKEPYIKAAPIYDGAWTVPADSYFVLGDNRNRSNDSHNWGMLPGANLIGRGVFVYWPANHIEVLIGDGTSG